MNPVKTVLLAFYYEMNKKDCSSDVDLSLFSSKMLTGGRLYIWEQLRMASLQIMILLYWKDIENETYIKRFRDDKNKAVNL